MLEHYFKQPYTLVRLRVGPLGEHMDGLAEVFRLRGYHRLSARDMLRGVAHFSHYLHWRGVTRADEITQDHVTDFLERHLPTCSCERPNAGAFKDVPSALRHLLDYLHAQGIMVAVAPQITDDPIDQLLVQYHEHLEKIRGLAPKSRNTHLRLTRRFLLAHRQKHGALQLDKLTAREVLEYFQEAVALHFGLDWKSGLVGCLRGFLRYLRWKLTLAEDLSRVVPSVIYWKLADLPKHISPEQARALTQAPDSTTPRGRRDRAILMLLATTGMRAGEMAMLKLEQVDWRQMCVTVPAAKSRRERMMPLDGETGQALADYLRDGRPAAASREIFIRSYAPWVPLSSSAIGGIVRLYACKIGLDVSHKGAHMLRHTLATRLINEDVPLKEIADILGHTNIQTTLIYTKVDVRRLGELPLPFPQWEKGEEA